MKNTDKPPSAKVPRLKDTEFTTISARIPTAQAEWLEERAAEGFRGRADQIAWVIAAAYHKWKDSEA